MSELKFKSRWLLTWVIAALIPDLALAQKCYLEAGSEPINALANYQLTYLPLSTTWRNENIVAMKLTIAKEATMRLGGSSLSCTDTAPDNLGFSTTTPTCTGTTASDGTITIILGDMVSRRPAYEVSIAQLQNPKSALTATEYVKCSGCLDTACTSFVDDITNRATLIYTSITSTTADALTVSSSSTLNGDKTATLSATYTLNQILTENGQIKLRLPKYNLNYKTLGFQYPDALLVGGNLPTVTYTATIGYQLASSSSTTSITISNQAYVIDSVDFTTDDVHLTLTVPELEAGTKLHMTVGLINNPPSTNPLSGFQFFTYDANGNEIELWQESTAGFYTTTAGTLLSGTTLELVGDNVVSATGTSFKFTVMIANDMPNNGRVEIGFPAAYPVDANNVPTISCESNCSFTQSGIEVDTINNKLILKDGFTSSVLIKDQQPGFIFTLGGFTNPPTVTGFSFTMATYNYDTNYYPIDSKSDGFSVTYVSGGMTVNSIMPVNTVISEFGSYIFNLTPDHPIEPDYILVMTLPEELEVISKFGCTVMGLAKESGYGCITEGAFRQITLTTFTDESLPAKSTLNFTVDQIINPHDYIDLGSAYFILKHTDGSLVDTGSYTFTTDLFTESFIQSFTAVCLDCTAGLYPSTYEFTVIPKAKVPQGSYLVMTVPPEIEIPDVSPMYRGCAYEEVSGFSTDRINCEYSERRHEFKIINGLTWKPSADNPPTLVWRIPYLQNPRGEISSGMFNVTMYNKDDKLLFVYNQTVGPSVTMRGVSEARSIEYSRSSNQNGVEMSLEFRIRPTNNLVAGDIMSITVPPPIQFSRQSTCIGTSYWVTGELPCTFSGDRQTAHFTLNVKGISRRLEEENEEEEGFLQESETGQKRKLEERIPTGSLIMIKLTGLSSPVSWRPTTGTVKYAVTSAEGKAIEAMTTDLIFENSEWGELDKSLIEISPSYWEKGKPADYSFIITPNNFEMGMIIYVLLPSQVKVPENWEKKCRGVKGTSTKNIRCMYEQQYHRIIFYDALSDKDVKPDTIEFVIENLRNPEENVVTDSFGFMFYSNDYYPIDRVEGDLTLNFYCLFPCKTCNQSDPEHCFTCYTETTPYKFLFDKQCFEDCPFGMYELVDFYKIEPPTCDYCDFPCATCGDNSTDCVTCAPGYLLYEVDHTCYEEIHWYFPFLAASIFFFFLVSFADCCFESNQFLHAILYFFSFLENGIWGCLIYLYLTGKVKGDRTITMVSLGVSLALNLLYIIVHCKWMIGDATPEFQMVLKRHKFSSCIVNACAYLINFKMSLCLISHFCSRPRFSGTFSDDSWQKFNLFGILYICFVYLPFIADFYLYFTEHGLRTLVSYVAIEAVVIMTMISLALLLELINQCNCGGIKTQNLGKRAGLYEKRKKKTKRRSLRSGMGNEEDDYGSYDSEYDEEYDSEEIELDHVTPSLKTKNQVTPNKVTPGKLVGKGPLGNEFNDEEYYDEEYDEEEDNGPIRMQIQKKTTPYQQPEVIKQKQKAGKQATAKPNSQGASDSDDSDSGSSHSGEIKEKKSKKKAKKTKKGSTQSDDSSTPEGLEDEESEEDSQANEDSMTHIMKKDKTGKKAKVPKKEKPKEKEKKAAKEKKPKKKDGTNDESEEEKSGSKSSKSESEESEEEVEEINEKGQAVKKEKPKKKEKEKKADKKADKKPDKKTDKKEPKKDSKKEAKKDKKPDKSKGSKSASNSEEEPEESEETPDEEDAVDEKGEKVVQKEKKQKSTEKAKKDKKPDKEKDKKADKKDKKADKKDKKADKKGKKGDPAEEDQEDEDLSEIAEENDETPDAPKKESKKADKKDDKKKVKKDKSPKRDKSLKAEKDKSPDKKKDKKDKSPKRDDKKKRKDKGDDTSRNNTESDDDLKSALSKPSNRKESKKKDKKDEKKKDKKDKKSKSPKRSKKDEKSDISMARGAPLKETMNYSMSMEGDEQQWMQNINGAQGHASDISRGRDASTIRGFNNSEGINDGVTAAHLARTATQEEYFEGQSAMYSNIEDIANRSLTNATPLRQKRGIEGTQIDHMEERSADFGDVSVDPRYNMSNTLPSQIGSHIPSQSGIRNKSPVNKADADGRSDESSEGIVADHAPFNGIQEAIENQEKLRKSHGKMDNFSPTSEDPPKEESKNRESNELLNQSIEEDNRPSARRRIKQVLYSDKSESSVDDMMEDTPSNYNVANGRLEGKSMGLKAILLYAKKQGIQLGAHPGGESMPQIKEETNHELTRMGHQSSGEGGRQWRAANQPISNDTGDMPLVGEDLRDGASNNEESKLAKNMKSKRNPGAKQFKEPSENGSVNAKNIRKNNFL